MAGVGVAVALALAGPAAAGSSHFDFEQASYRPGDQARAIGIVAWDHNPDLGRPEDGPFSAWLVPPDTVAPATFGVPPSAIYVDEVQIFEEPYRVGAVSYGPNHAVVEFAVPDLPAGDYQLFHCNTPCTTHLGDIIGGQMTIAPGVSTTTTTAPTTTTTVPATTAPVPTTTVAQQEVEPLVAESGDSDGPGPLAALVVLGLGIVVTSAVWMLLGRRPRSSSSGSPEVARLSDA